MKGIQMSRRYDRPAWIGIAAAVMMLVAVFAAYGGEPGARTAAEKGMEGFVLFMRDSLPGDRAGGYALMLEAAWEGDARSANNVGWLLQHGEFVDRDAVSALRWYGRAAGQGLPAAALNWLDMIEEEPEALEGKLPDRKALGDAAYLAGTALARGRGLHYDPRKGELLILKAALFGNGRAAVTVAQQLEMYPDSYSGLPLERIAAECDRLMPPEARNVGAGEEAAAVAGRMLTPEYWYGRVGSHGSVGLY